MRRGCSELIFSETRRREKVRQRTRGKFKDRTLKTEGCGTHPPARDGRRRLLRIDILGERKERESSPANTRKSRRPHPQTEGCGTQNRPFVATSPVGKPKRETESKTEGIGGPRGGRFQFFNYGRSGLSRASWRAQTVRSVVMPMAYQMNLLRAALTGEPPPLLPPAPRGPCGADAALGGSRTMR